MLSVYEFTTTSLVSGIVKAVVNGNKTIRIILAISLLLGVIAFTLVSLVENKTLDQSYDKLAIGLAIMSAVGVVGIYGYQTIQDDLEKQEQIKEVEDRIKENPSETAAAWELGRIKLESYLNRNLVQIQWIFIWTVIVMLIGFFIIGIGITKLYDENSALKVGILTTTTGLIIEFLGASFLVIYKSTMQQAKDYVTVLERINAVGMSVQILESISKEEVKLQDQSKANLAKQLLEVYGGFQR